MSNRAVTADAVQEIERLVRAAEPVKIQRPSGFPEHTVAKVIGETVEIITVPPPLMKRKLWTPTDLIEFANREGEIGKSAIYFDGAAIVFLADRNDPRDAGICRLVKTDQFEWLELNPRKKHSQADFIRALRISLRGCLPADVNLLATVRSVKVENGQILSADIAHGKESVSKSVRSQVSAATEIPEEVTLSVQVFYEMATPRALVACAVEVFPAEGAFALTPFPGELERAMDHVLEAIRSILESTDAELPVYRGSP